MSVISSSVISGGRNAAIVGSRPHGTNNEVAASVMYPPPHPAFAKASLHNPAAKNRNADFAAGRLDRGKPLYMKANGSLYDARDVFCDPDLCHKVLSQPTIPLYAPLLCSPVHHRWNLQLTDEDRAIADVAVCKLRQDRESLAAMLALEMAQGAVSFSMALEAERLGAAVVVGLASGERCYVSDRALLRTVPDFSHLKLFVCLTPYAALVSTELVVKPRDLAHRPARHWRRRGCTP